MAASRRLSPFFTTESQSAAGDHLFQAASYTLTALLGLFAGKVA